MLLLRLFGHPVIERDGVRTPVGVPPKALALTALLTANAARPLSREWLAQALWPDAASAEGRANLRRHCHLLGKTLGEDALVLSRHTAQWNSRCSVSVDVVRFDDFLQRQPVLAIQEYGGDLCAGVEDEALTALRARYRFNYETLLRTRIEELRSSGDDAELAVWLQHAINHDPYDEHSVVEIMRLRMRHGDRAGALHEFNALAQRLRSELGVEPAPETTELFRRFADSEAQLRSPNNLPVPTTTFVGRERELNAVISAVRESRAATLVGPGGIGKSRLALRAAFNLLSEYPDGAWFVSLEHADGEHAIWEQIVGAFEIGRSGTVADVVLQRLRNAKALLIFDRCEHVAEDARRVVERLLKHTEVRVLATSRRQLRVDAECVIDLSPLDIPPEDQREIEPMRFAAYRLFIERATAVSPAFRVDPRQTRVLRQVLTRTDGLPLAIELVAARANVLTLEGMRKGLRSAMRAPHRLPAGARAQTIDDTIAWTVDLLTPFQREVFYELAAFRSFFDLNDVEQLCGSPEAVEALFELVDASLVTVAGSPDGVRYRLLDSTRAYAEARLLESGGDETRARHAEWAARKAQQIAGAPEEHLASLLAAALNDMPDYFAAVDYSIACGLPALTLAIVEGIHRFGVRSYFTHEMLARVQKALGSFSPRQPRLVRIAAMLAHTAERYDEALDLVRESAKMYRQAGDESSLADVLSDEASIFYSLGRLQESENLLAESCERAKRAGATRIYLKSAGRLGALLTSYDRALELLAPLAEQLLRLGEFGQAAFAYRSLAAVAFGERRWDDAVNWAERSIPLLAASAGRATQALLLTVRGCAQQEAGNVEASLRSHLEALKLCSFSADPGETIDCLEHIAATLSNLEEFAAARLIGFAARVRAEARMPHAEQQGRYCGPIAGRLSSIMGGAYEAERAAGCQMSAEQAVDLAGRLLTERTALYGERPIGR